MPIDVSRLGNKGKTFSLLIAVVLTGCNLFTELDEAQLDMDVDMATMDVGDIGEDGTNTDLGDDASEVDLCVPETDSELCQTALLNCDDAEITDSCGSMRTVNCGTCDAEICGQFLPNVCGCPCQIGAQCFPAGAINPDLNCQYCDPELDTMGWSVNDPDCLRDFPVGEVVRVDFGPTVAPDWTKLGLNETVGPLDTVDGNPTSVVVVASGFNGDQNGGALTTTLGIPPEVTRDTIWSGNFDGHDAALLEQGIVLAQELPTGSYRVQIFGSRDGDDGGMGRLSRYQIGEQFIDYEPSNQMSEYAVFDAVDVMDTGSIELTVSVSPDGTGRFSYIGSMEIERLQ